MYVFGYLCIALFWWWRLIKFNLSLPLGVTASATTSGYAIPLLFSVYTGLWLQSTKPLFSPQSQWCLQLLAPRSFWLVVWKFSWGHRRGHGMPGIQGFRTHPCWRTACIHSALVSFFLLQIIPTSTAFCSCNSLSHDSANLLVHHHHCILGFFSPWAQQS